MKKQRNLLIPLLVAVGVIAVVSIVVLTLLGPSISSVFSNVASMLGGTNTPRNATEVANLWETVTAVAQQASQSANRPTQTLISMGSPSLTETNPTVPAVSASDEASEPTRVSDIQPTDTLLPTSTQGSETIPRPTITPVEVAAVPLKIISVSGAVIGDGTLRVFAPASVRSPETARVELELRLDNRYITPTPFGAITPIALTQVTSTPLPGLPTPTPRFPIHETSGLEIYQRMGASLLCSSASFDGCDPKPDPAAARIISVSGVTWTWIVSPKSAISGAQDITLELWTVNQIEGGAEQVNVVWDYGFRIGVNVEASSLPLPLILAGAAVLGGAGALGVWLLRKRGGAPAVDKKRHPRPIVFISYRRAVGWSIARTIHDNLTSRGANVFIDVEDINEGRFEEIIKQAIRDCDYFVLVLTPDTLDSEWVFKEARYAIDQNKRIIPVLANGFDLYENSLPEDLKSIQRHNAITLLPEFFNAAMDRLAQFVGLADDSDTNSP